jgi:hypothetical protein
MAVASRFVLPIESAYIGHRDAEERRKQVADWLHRRERELDDPSSPPVVPEPTASDGGIRLPEWTGESRKPGNSADMS